MMKAVFAHPHNGHEYERNRNSELGLVVGEKYDIERVNIFGFRTELLLTAFPGESFNSVQFKIENDDGTPKDIFADPALNPYLLAPAKRVYEEKQMMGYITDAVQINTTVIGYIKGHPNYSDGDMIRTSPVKSISKNDDGSFEVETSNSIYNVTLAEGEVLSMS